MAIEKGYITNLQTIEKAAKNNAMGLVECTEKEGGKRVVVLCAFHRDDEAMIVVTPLARMFDDNPYETLCPPADKHEPFRMGKAENGGRA